MTNSELIAIALGVPSLVISILATIASRSAAKRAEDLRVAVATETATIKTDVGWLKVLVNEIRGKKRKEH